MRNTNNPPNLFWKVFVLYENATIIYFLGTAFSFLKSHKSSVKAY